MASFGLHDVTCVLWRGWKKEEWGETAEHSRHRDVFLAQLTFSRLFGNIPTAACVTGRGIEVDGWNHAEFGPCGDDHLGSGVAAGVDAQETMKREGNGDESASAVF